MQGDAAQEQPGGRGTLGGAGGRAQGFRPPVRGSPHRQAPARCACAAASQQRPPARHSSCSAACRPQAASRGHQTAPPLQWGRKRGPVAAPVGHAAGRERRQQGAPDAQREGVAAGKRAQLCSWQSAACIQATADQPGLTQQAKGRGRRLPEAQPRVRLLLGCRRRRRACTCCRACLRSHPWGGGRAVPARRRLERLLAALAAGQGQQRQLGGAAVRGLPLLVAHLRGVRGRVMCSSEHTIGPTAVAHTGRYCQTVAAGCPPCLAGKACRGGPRALAAAQHAQPPRNSTHTIGRVATPRPTT